ncbi:MAG: 2-oxoacid:acceptor oxidoreductase subunit alpha [FCB group bacterium]|nr:2-oxoacid:acceptor oxidoreductase subunit alpha [FCB group bacterium]
MMEADPIGVATGNHYIDGDHACAEGAIAAGCRFFAGYPITPSTEVAERIAERFPKVGGLFIQMEDELASMAAIIGAAWSGSKAMTVTSGPGFSLMMENLGLATMLETPCVLVNVQRGGPSTGLPTLTGQADMMQARWGSHGDYEIIALSPNSPQECFDLTVTAFNLAETWRVPVLFMMDECVGHMTEKVVIPEAKRLHVVPRKYYRGKKESYRPFSFNGSAKTAPMVKTGDGYFIHVTGLTHDERGYPVINAETQDKNVRHLVNKIRDNEEKIRLLEEDGVADADVIVIAYGISSRVALKAVNDARNKGIKVGTLRLITVWPFPEKRIRELAATTKAFVVPEINMGQIALEVERASRGRAKTLLVPHAGGWVHNPNDILKAIEEGAA